MSGFNEGARTATCNFVVVWATVSFRRCFSDSAAMSIMLNGIKYLDYYTFLEVSYSRLYIMRA